MNKIKKSYCNNGYHPKNWLLWHIEYDSTTESINHYCSACGMEIPENICGTNAMYNTEVIRNMQETKLYTIPGLPYIGNTCTRQVKKYQNLIFEKRYNLYKKYGTNLWCHDYMHSVWLRNGKDLA